MLNENDQPSGLLGSVPVSIWVLLAFVFVLLSTESWFCKHVLIPGLPVAGRRWAFEPLFVTRFRFVLGGWQITREGLTTVSFILEYCVRVEDRADDLRTSIQIHHLPSFGRTRTSRSYRVVMWMNCRISMTIGCIHSRLFRQCVQSLRPVCQVESSC